MCLPSACWKTSLSGLYPSSRGSRVDAVSGLAQRQKFSTHVALFDRSGPLARPLLGHTITDSIQHQAGGGPARSDIAAATLQRPPGPDEVRCSLCIFLVPLRAMRSFRSLLWWARHRSRICRFRAYEGRILDKHCICFCTATFSFPPDDISTASTTSLSFSLFVNPSIHPQVHVLRPRRGVSSGFNGPLRAAILADGQVAGPHTGGILRVGRRGGR